MPLITLQPSCPLHDSFRVQQVLGMFDMPDVLPLSERYTVELPDETEPWQIGMIVGPTGSGKSSVARKAYGRNVYAGAAWPDNRAVIDCLGDWPIRDITRMLSLVGFSSPPSWIKPFAVLSNGEKFRCELARALLRGSVEDCGLRTEPGSPGSAHVTQAAPAESTSSSTDRAGFQKLSTQRSAFSTSPIVFDEFTSHLDRTVARIASAAISRAIRGGKINRRLVAVTCHDDIIPWLSPDWVLNMATQTLTRQRIRPPRLQLEIRRCDREMWPLFRRHHYLSGNLHRAAQCYLGTIENRPAVFVAVLPFPHPRRPGWREHRLVCLPDFQGIGIGGAMSSYIASLYVATNKPYFSTSGHPAVMQSRANSPLWKMIRRPGLASACGKAGAEKTGMRATRSAAHFTAGFEYVGKWRGGEANELGLLRSVK